MMVGMVAAMSLWRATHAATTHPDATTSTAPTSALDTTLPLKLADVAAKLPDATISTTVRSPVNTAHAAVKLAHRPDESIAVPDNLLPLLQAGEINRDAAPAPG